MSSRTWNQYWTTAALAAVMLMAWPVARANDVTTSPRLVAIGDVHGNLGRLQGLLRQTGLIDQQDRWIGGNSIFVQTGDFTDRGAEVRQTMDLLMRIQKEAAAAGGRAVILMGNHEMMNLMGDFRYVHPDVYRSFADDHSENRRRKAFDRYLKTRQRIARELGDPVPTADEVEPAWMAARPLGYLEYVDALGPDGHYGKWIRKLPIIDRIQDVLFVHGGIHPSLAPLSTDEFNSRVDKERKLLDSVRRQLYSRRWADPAFTLEEIFEVVRRRLETINPPALSSPSEMSWVEPREDNFLRVLARFAEIGQWLSVHPDGPLWFRGLATWPEEEGIEHVNRLLELQKARSIVVGHTIAAKRTIDVRYDGRVFLIDTMAPSALVLEDGEFSGVYLEGVEGMELTDEPLAHH